MKQLKKMIILGVLLVLYSCATQEPAPVMPKFATEEGKVCARQCQQTYALCNGACSGIIGYKQRRQCLDNCNQTLGECYSTCE